MVPRSLFAAALLAIASGSAAHAEFEKIDDRSTFAAAITGKALTRAGIKLNLSREGQIEGRAFGRPVSGQWVWQDGYFCRDLFWGKKELGYNCQQVARSGNDLRFTSDRGQGDSADLRLR